MYIILKQKEMRKVWQNIVLQDNHKCCGLGLDEELHNLKKKEPVYLYKPVMAKLYLNIKGAPQKAR